MIMKIFALIALAFSAATVSFASEGTISVLKTSNEPTPAVAQPTAAVAQPTAQACCQEVEEVRAVKLSPWTVRRLNRVADRQEARDARKCCCDPCDCNKTKTVLVESRKKTCNCR